MKKLDFPDLNTCKQFLSYNKKEGCFYWIKTSSVRAVAGKPAGTKRKNGYIVISLKGKLVLAHRLVWFFEKEQWPSGVIDHINGNTSDNKIENLRDVSMRKNMQNIYFHRNGRPVGAGYKPRRKKWQARIIINGKQKHLGYYKTAEEASEVYKRYCEENNL